MNERDGNGRFKIGNQGGPGRPRRATESEYLDALADSVPLDKWREICENAARNALAGDGKAREWLGKYLLPVPRELPSSLLAAADLYTDPLDGLSSVPLELGVVQV